jgi:hypothetical protein
VRRPIGQLILGMRGAPDAHQDVAAARPASVPKTKRPDRFCPTVWAMAPRYLPTPQDAATVRQILFDGLAQGTEVAELAALHPPNDTFPGEVFLNVGADVLDWCGASRADPLALAGMRERFLPECAFRGRQNKKLQFAILAAAALRGGAEPDLLGEVAWWQTDDFWQYALYAVVAYVRAAAGWAGVPVRQVCQELAQRDGPRPG